MNEHVCKECWGDVFTALSSGAGNAFYRSSRDRIGVHPGLSCRASVTLVDGLGAFDTVTLYVRH